MFIIGVIECDLFQHLKHRYMKVDIQIVKLRQKTEPHLVEYSTSFFRKWVDKVWEQCGNGTD